MPRSPHRWTQCSFNCNARSWLAVSSHPIPKPQLLQTYLGRLASICSQHRTGSSSTCILCSVLRPSHAHEHAQRTSASNAGSCFELSLRMSSSRAQHPSRSPQTNKLTHAPWHYALACTHTNPMSSEFDEVLGANHTPSSLLTTLRSMHASRSSALPLSELSWDVLSLTPSGLSTV